MENNINARVIPEGLEDHPYIQSICDAANLIRRAVLLEINAGRCAEECSFSIMIKPKDSPLAKVHSFKLPNKKPFESIVVDLLNNAKITLGGSVFELLLHQTRGDDEKNVIITDVWLTEGNGIQTGLADPDRVTGEVISGIRTKAGVGRNTIPGTPAAKRK